MRSDHRRPILVVEDEFLIGLLVADALTAAGFRLIGPLATLAEALDSVRSKSFDAALLDIQLAHGEDVYPVAEVLARVPLDGRCEGQSGHSGQGGPTSAG